MAACGAQVEEPLEAHAPGDAERSQGAMKESIDESHANLSTPEELVEELNIPTLEAEIEAVEVKIAELKGNPDLDRSGKRELYKLNNKRDNLREQVDALRNVELAAEKAETAAEKAETAAEQQRTKDLQEALEQARKLS